MSNKKVKTKVIYSLLLVGLLLALFSLYYFLFQDISSKNEYEKKVTEIKINGEKLNLEEYRFRYSIVNDFWKQMGFNLQGNNVKDINSNINETLLYLMIQDELIRQKAKELNIQISSKEIEEYKQDLEKPSIEMKDSLLNRQLELQLLELKVLDKLKKEVEVTEGEMKKYYQDNKDKFIKKETITAKHILLNNKEDAEKVLILLKEGNNFEDIAKKYSKDTLSGQYGGDIGTFSKGVMTPEFDKIAFNTEKGSISNIIKTTFGYHIVKVEEKTKAEEIRFDKIKETIRKEILKEKQNDIIEQFYNNLDKEVANKI